MGVATTFGVASTGTAISTLSGAAATNAALAWLGGGALAAGGSGIAGGQALLAMAGPIGWAIAGVSIFVSGLLFWKNHRAKKRLDEIFIQISDRDIKGVNIIEAEVCVDHVHMLLEIPPKMSVSSFMGYLKGKSSLMIFEKWGNMRYKYRNREFWCRGYYVDTVGKDTKKIQTYIQNQLKEDEISGQLTLEEADPFTGSK